MNSRRKFIRNVTLSSAGLALAHKALHAGYPFGSVPKTGRKLRVALMGLGGYARMVADAMQECQNAVITGLISGTPSKLESWSSKYKVPRSSCYSYEDFNRIADNQQIDAVYVLTPNALHHPHTLAAANAGKHVICEKPMAVNAREAAEMMAACKAAGRQLLIGYRMHFESNTLEIIRMRKAGELGKILFFQGLSGFRLGNPNQWRLDLELAGGGSLMDIGIYSVNGARYMMGEEPIWVTAQETKTNPAMFKPGIDETIQFQLGFPSGAVASCLSTYSMNHLDRFFLNGSEGFAELQPATGYGPIRGRTHKGELNLPHRRHQAVQMDEMAAIILENKLPVVPVDGEEGWKDMVIVDAIYEAVKLGREVSINLDYENNV